MQNRSIHYLITCEHASNALPDEWSHLYSDADAQAVLETHRGWDPGSLELGKALGKKFSVEPIIYPWSRLLIEPNRSLHHPALFSKFTQMLSRENKEELINTYWKPHRERIIQNIQEAISNQKRVVHIGAHTFTPVWKGTERTVDIGLLYDPKRKKEQEFCQHWKIELSQSFPDLRIYMNRPYLGSADGLTTSLRKKFDEENYLGIELELNQNACLEFIDKFTDSI